VITFANEQRPRSSAATTPAAALGAGARGFGRSHDALAMLLGMLQ